MSDKAATGNQRKAAGGKKQTAALAHDGAHESEAGGQPVTDRGPPEGVRALALDYPFALVAGGLAVGVLIGALLPRRQASRLSRPLLAVAGAASEFGLAYAQKALTRATAAAHDATAAGSRLLEAAADHADDLAESAGDHASDYAGRAAAAAGAAPAAIRDSGRKLAQSVVRLTSQLRH